MARFLSVDATSVCRWRSTSSVTSFSTSDSASAYSSSSASSCVTFDLEADYADYYAACQQAPAQEGVPVVRPGVRVTLLCALAGVRTKDEFPAGTTGRVWALQDDGILVVAVDNKQCEAVHVHAELADLAVQTALAVGTKVNGCGLVVRGTEGEPMNIPSTAVGEVLSYNAETNVYEVAYWSFKKKIAVPARQVQPAANATWKRIVASAAAPITRKLRRSSGAAGEAVAADGQCVANLRKAPAYSSLRGSPRGTFRASQCA